MKGKRGLCHVRTDAQSGSPGGTHKELEVLMFSEDWTVSQI